MGSSAQQRRKCGNKTEIVPHTNEVNYYRAHIARIYKYDASDLAILFVRFSLNCEENPSRTMAKKLLNLYDSWYSWYFMLCAPSSFIQIKPKCVCVCCDLMSTQTAAQSARTHTRTQQQIFSAAARRAHQWGLFRRGRLDSRGGQKERLRGAAPSN